MSRFFDPTGRSTFGIGICARCQKKMSLDDLQDDPNIPGLKVCAKDRDQLDPYRLPYSPPDKDITLPFVRPDVPLE
jgi:hypothetical protein